MSKVLNKRRISFFSPGKYSVLYIREKRGGRGSKEITLLGSRGGGGRVKQCNMDIRRTCSPFLHGNDNPRFAEPTKGTAPNIEENGSGSGKQTPKPKRFRNITTVVIN